CCGDGFPRCSRQIPRPASRAYLRSAVCPAASDSVETVSLDGETRIGLYAREQTKKRERPFDGGGEPSAGALVSSSSRTRARTFPIKIPAFSHRAATAQPGSFQF